MGKLGHKKIPYTDKFGNEIDVNTREGLYTVLNDLFADCKTKEQCSTLLESIHLMASHAELDRVEEILKEQENEMER